MPLPTARCEQHQRRSPSPTGAHQRQQQDARQSEPDRQRVEAADRRARREPIGEQSAERDRDESRDADRRRAVKRGVRQVETERIVHVRRRPYGDARRCASAEEEHAQRNSAGGRCTTTRSGPRSDLRASLASCAARAGASCSILYSTTHQTMPAAAEDDERRLPAEAIGDQAGRIRAESRAGEHSGLMNRQRAAAHRRPMPIADQRGAGRVIRRLAERDHAAQREQHRESGCERDQARRDAPERETADDDPRAARAVAEAPEQERGERVDPEERRVDQRELLGREPELLAQLRHDRDQDRAVRRIQERDHPQQADQDPRVVRGRARAAAGTA